MRPGVGPRRGSAVAARAGALAAAQLRSRGQGGPRQSSWGGSKHQVVDTKEGLLASPELAPLFVVFAFLGPLCFPLTRQKTVFAGVLVPAKLDVGGEEQVVWHSGISSLVVWIGDLDLK